MPHVLLTGIAARRFTGGLSEFDVEANTVRRMITEKKLPATQVIACAPWQIPAVALQSETLRIETENIKAGIRSPRTRTPDGQQVLFSET